MTVISENGGMIVVASVGTDHHPFTRLADWLERWIQHNRDIEVRFQHGATRPIAGAHNVDRLAHRELLAWLEQADAVVLQGGPGGIMDSLSVGIRPIVVPRIARLNEVVDDHQVDFCARLHSEGVITVATSRQGVDTLLDQTVEGTLDWRAERDEGTPPGVLAIKDQLRTPPRRTDSIWHRARALRSGRKHAVK